MPPLQILRAFNRPQPRGRKYKLVRLIADRTVKAADRLRLKIRELVGRHAHARVDVSPSEGTGQHEQPVSQMARHRRNNRFVGISPIDADQKEHRVRRTIDVAVRDEMLAQRLELSAKSYERASGTACPRRPKQGPGVRTRVGLLCSWWTAPTLERQAALARKTPVDLITRHRDA